MDYMNKFKDFPLYLEIRDDLKTILSRFIDRLRSKLKREATTHGVNALKWAFQLASNWHNYKYFLHPKEPL